MEIKNLDQIKYEGILTNSEKRYLEDLANQEENFQSDLLKQLTESYNIQHLLENYEDVKDGTENAALIQLYLKLKLAAPIEIDGDLSKSKHHIDNITSNNLNDVPLKQNSNAAVDLNIDPYLKGVDEIKSKHSRFVANKIFENIQESDKATFLNDQSLLKDIVNRSGFYSQYLSNVVKSRNQDVYVFDQGIDYNLLKAIENTELGEKEIVSEKLVHHYISLLVCKKTNLSIDDPIITQLQQFKVNPLMLNDIGWINDIKILLHEDRQEPLFYLKMLNMYYKGSTSGMKNVFRELLIKNNLYNQEFVDKYMNVNGDLSGLLLDEHSKDVFLQMDGILSNQLNTKDGKVKKVEELLKQAYNGNKLSNEFVERTFPLIMKKYGMESDLKYLSDINFAYQANKNHNENLFALDINSLNVTIDELFKDNSQDIEAIKKVFQSLVLKSREEYSKIVDESEETVSRYEHSQVFQFFFENLKLELENGEFSNNEIQNILKKLNPKNQGATNLLYKILQIKILDESRTIISDKVNSIIFDLKQKFPDLVNGNKSDNKLLVYLLNETLANPNLTEEEIRIRYYRDEVLLQGISNKIVYGKIDESLSKSYTILLNRLKQDNITNLDLLEIKLEKFKLDSKDKILKNNQIQDPQKADIIDKINSSKTLGNVIGILGEAGLEVEQDLSEIRSNTFFEQRAQSVLSTIWKDDRFKEFVNNNSVDISEQATKLQELKKSKQSGEFEEMITKSYYESIGKEYFKDEYISWKRKQVEKEEKKDLPVTATKTIIDSTIDNNLTKEKIIIPERIDYKSNNQALNPFDENKIVNGTSYLDLNKKILSSFLLKNGFENKIKGIEIGMIHDDFHKIFGLDMDKPLDKDFFDKFINQLSLVFLNYINDKLNSGKLSAEESSLLGNLKINLLFGDVNNSVLQFIKLKEGKFLSDIGMFDLNNNFNFYTLSTKMNLKPGFHYTIEQDLDKLRLNSQKIKF